MGPMNELADRVAAVQERIAAAAARAGREPAAITLVAVTKTWPAAVVAAAFDAGLRHFGENRAEELAAKRPEVERLLGSPADLVWHAIGALQSRKTDLIADSADQFHALDRLKIARRLSARLVENGRAERRPLAIYVEVNVSGEASKAGLDCSHWEDDAAQRQALLRLAEDVSSLPGLVPQGLMMMAPWHADPTAVRHLFCRTRELAAWLQAAEPDHDWSKLSMGMTDDFELAIEEGATHIRVGRALFGERTDPTANPYSEG
jgi:hypothetical protein